MATTPHVVFPSAAVAATLVSSCLKMPKRDGALCLQNAVLRLRVGSEPSSKTESVLSVCSEGLLCRGMTRPIFEKVYSVILERAGASGVGQGERLRSQLRTERTEHDVGLHRAAAGT